MKTHCRLFRMYFNLYQWARAKSVHLCSVCCSRRRHVDAAVPNNSMHVLNELFYQRVISRGLWPPHSPDLSPRFLLMGLSEKCGLCESSTHDCWAENKHHNSHSSHQYCHAPQSFTKSGKTNTLLYSRKRMSFPTFIVTPKVCLLKIKANISTNLCDTLLSFKFSNWYFYGHLNFDVRDFKITL